MGDIPLFVTVGRLMYREALLYQLLQHEDINLIGEASTGVETLEALPFTGPAVLIIEEELSDNDGLTVTEMALARNPALSVLLLVETRITQSRLSIYLEAGINTVVAKSQPLSDLLKSLYYIREGQVYVDPTQIVLDAGRRTPNSDTQYPVSIQSFLSLSEREQEVARQMADRIPVKTIADRLGVSHKTVHSYKDRIFVKMGFEKTAELILFMKRISRHIESDRPRSGARHMNLLSGGDIENHADEGAGSAVSAVSVKESGC